MSIAIGNQNVSDRKFKEAQDEKCEIIQELQRFLPKDSPCTNEVCFQAVWQACEAEEWESIEKIQTAIHGLIDSAGQCIFFKYIQEENKDKITQIIEKNLHHVLSNNQFSFSLHAVARSGSISIIDVLKISGGGTCTKRDIKGRFPLHMAIKYGHAGLISKLSDTTPDGFVWTRFSYFSNKYQFHVCPVSLSIIKGNIECLDTLIAHGNLSLVEMQFEKIGSILHLAVKVQKSKMLKHLLNHYHAQTKSIINIQDNLGRTPLILAAILNDPVSLALLIKKGADPRCRDSDGNSAMYHAMFKRNKKIILLLNQYSPKLLNSIKPNRLITEKRLSEDNPDDEAFLNFIANLNEINNKAKKDPWNYLLHPPENLAFKGGGPKGIAYLGVVRVLEKRNMLEHVKRVAGTSAGAITAMFIALGYDSKDVEKILEETPFTDFLDHPLTGEQIQKAIHNNLNIKKLWDAYQEISRMVSDCVAQVSLKPAVKVMEEKALGFLWGCPGLCAGDKFLQWLEERVYQKTNIRNCTFGELKQLIEQGKKNPKGKAYKHLHVFGIRLGERTQIQRFSSEDLEWEELIIADALRLSMSIPGLFKPYSPRFKQKNGEIYTKNVSYVDGGLVFNYPVEAFDQKQYLENGLSEKEKRRYAFNPKTLGFSLFAPPAQKDVVEKPIETLKDLIVGVFTVYRRAQELILKNNLHDEERTIELDHQGIGLTEFSTHPSSGKGKKAIEEAEEKMEAFFLDLEKEVTDFSKTPPPEKESTEPASDSNKNQEKSGSKAVSDHHTHDISIKPGSLNVRKIPEPSTSWDGFFKKLEEIDASWGKYTHKPGTTNVNLTLNERMALDGAEKKLKKSRSLRVDVVQEALPKAILERKEALTADKRKLKKEILEFACSYAEVLEILPSSLMETITDEQILELLIKRYKEGKLDEVVKPDPFTIACRKKIEALIIEFLLVSLEIHQLEKASRIVESMRLELKCVKEKLRSDIFLLDKEKVIEAFQNETSNPKCSNSMNWLIFSTDLYYCLTELASRLRFSTWGDVGKEKKAMQAYLLELPSRSILDNPTEFLTFGTHSDRIRLYSQFSIDSRFQLFEYLKESKQTDANKEYEKWKDFYLQCMEYEAFIDDLVKNDRKEHFLFFKEKGNIKLHSRTPYGPTLFHCAFRYDSLNIFITLLEFPDAAFPIDEEGNTILHFLIKRSFNNIDFFKALEKHEKFNQLLNIKNSLNEPPIVLAINEIALIRKQQEHKNYVSFSLNHICQSNHVHIPPSRMEQEIKYYILHSLLDNENTDLTVTDPKSGETLLQLLVRERRFPEAEKLFSKWKQKKLIEQMKKILNLSKYSVLYDCFNFNGHNNLLKELISQGININHKCLNEESNLRKPFLCLLVERNELNLLKLLCKNLKKYYSDSYQDILNEEILLSDGKKKTALMIAAEKDHTKIVEFLMEEGADFQKRVDGMKPLDCASEAWFFPGAYEVIKEALQGKIKRNLTSAEKIGALSYCLKHMPFDAVKHLMTTKILPSPIRDIKDQSGNGILLILLLSAKINWDEKVELMTLLLNGTFQADINQANHNGTTPLMACLSNLNALDFFLKFDSLIPLDINYQNKGGNTALHYAAMNSNLQAVKALAVHPRIDVELKNQNGETPSHLASDPEIIKILFASFWKKVDVDFQSSNPH